MCDVHYPAFVWPGYLQGARSCPAQQTRPQSRGRWTDHHATVDRPSEVRVFGGDAEVVSTYVSDRGFSRTYSVCVPAGEAARISFALAISERERPLRCALCGKLRDARVAIGETDDFYERCCALATCARPIHSSTEPSIGRRSAPCECSTVFRPDHGFTNDPSQDIVVVRDAAWYALGSDYVTPEFSRRLFELIARHGIEHGGKVTEYIMACTDPPFKSDYDLNINDDTPLIVCAAYHYYSVTHDRAALELPLADGAGCLRLDHFTNRVTGWSSPIHRKRTCGESRDGETSFRRAKSQER